MRYGGGSEAVKKRRERLEIRKGNRRKREQNREQNKKKSTSLTIAFIFSIICLVPRRTITETYSCVVINYSPSRVAALQNAH